MYKIDEMLSDEGLLTNGSPSNGSDFAKYLKSANKLGCVISTDIFFQNLRVDSAHLIFNILTSLLIFGIFWQVVLLLQQPFVWFPEMI